MFSLSSSDRFFQYTYSTDMRKIFYTLSGIMTNQMGMDVQNGASFIFYVANIKRVNQKLSFDKPLLSILLNLFGLAIL